MAHYGRQSIWIIMGLKHLKAFGYPDIRWLKGPGERESIMFHFQKEASPRCVWLSVSSEPVYGSCSTCTIDIYWFQPKKSMQITFFCSNKYYKILRW